MASDDAPVTPESDTAAADTSTEVAVPEPAAPEKLDPDWKHQRLEYLGDNLAVRVPEMQALSAFMLASGKYIDGDRQNNMTSFFLDQHIGSDSYDRMLQRMMDPDDADYTTKSIAEVVRQLVEMATAANRDSDD